MEKNRLSEPFLIVASAFIVLIFLSTVNSQFSIAGYKTRKVDLLSDVIPKGRVNKPPHLISAFEYAKPELAKANAKRLAEKVKPLSSPGISQFGNDSTQGLAYFFNALDSCNARGKQVRIAYFGDSMIEGDLITQDLRRLLQDIFGGRGVGFVPVKSVTAGFRMTVYHSYSQNWAEYNFLGNSSHRPGISGQAFVPPVSGGDPSQNIEASWMKLNSSSLPHLDTFPSVKLFYGSSTGNNFISHEGQKIPLNGSSSVNSYTISSTPVKAVRVGFDCANPPDVYGLSIESPNGVIVDNFSFRGNSGLTLTKIPKEILDDFQRLMDYDLIVLQYGMNVINANLKDYRWYEEGMSSVVDHLKASFPTASILIVGASDKGYRQNGDYVTDPAVPFVVEAQRKVAEKTGSAFFNLFETMGGYNSMVNWVKGDTCLANRDYCHFNFRGAKKVAELLHSNLMLEYKKHNDRIVIVK